MDKKDHLIIFLSTVAIALSVLIGSTLTKPSFLSTKLEAQNTPAEEKQTVAIKLRPSDQAPTAVTLQILYDPQVLAAVTARPGNVWSQTNILQNKIDNQKGEILLSLGQGFEATTTGNEVLALVDFTAISPLPKKTFIKLGNGSEAAWVGMAKTLSVK